MHHERIIFKHNINPNDPAVFESFEKTIQELTLVGCAFTLMNDEENLTKQIHHITWQLPDELTEIHFLYDEHTEISSLSIKSPKAGLLRRIVEAFTKSFEFYTLKELIELAKQDFVQYPNVLLKMAMASKREDNEIIKIIASALDSYLPQVRYYATLAIALIPWKAFISELDCMLKMETDPDVKESAEYALRAAQK